MQKVIYSAKNMQGMWGTKALSLRSDTKRYAEEASGSFRSQNYKCLIGSREAIRKNTQIPAQGEPGLQGKLNRVAWEQEIGSSLCYCQALPEPTSSRPNSSSHYFLSPTSCQQGSSALSHDLRATQGAVLEMLSAQAADSHNLAFPRKQQH